MQENLIPGLIISVLASKVNKNLSWKIFVHVVYVGDGKARTVDENRWSGLRSEEASIFTLVNYQHAYIARIYLSWYSSLFRWFLFPLAASRFPLFSDNVSTTRPSRNSYKTCVAFNFDSRPQRSR